MTGKMERPAETLSSRGPDLLRQIYHRQFRESSQLRRHILSLLPLNQIDVIFEPGCGSGLLGREILSLTDAAYTGMDIQKELLHNSQSFVHGDAVASPQKADLYVTSYFFSSLRNPVRWLKKVRKMLSPRGLFAVFAEYDYHSIGEDPDMGIAGRIREKLEEQGLFTEHGENLDGYFIDAGFRKIHGGEITSIPGKPSIDFLRHHLEEIPCELPEMSWRVVWGIWRRS